MKKLVLIGLALMMLIAPASASFDVIRPNKDSWVCVSYVCISSTSEGRR